MNSRPDELLAGFLLIRRNWRALGVGFAACIVLALATGAIFGWEPIRTFIYDSPFARLPAEVHSELVNQSLYGTILRLTHSELEAHSARVNVEFALVAIVLTSISVLLASRSWREAPELSYSLILTCGLLVYPSTLAHYAICLVVPLLLLWRRQESRGGEWVVIAFMALVGLVTGIAHGRYAFWAIAATHFAFSQHRPLVLSPDMIWVTILQGLAQHVKNHAEKLRSQFVGHQGELAGLVRANEGTDFKGTIITSAISPFVTYSMLDACRIAVAHERRHFAQARRVTEAEGFPNS